MTEQERLIKGHSRYKVPNLERALVILEYLLDYPAGLGLSELTSALGFPKNSIFRITMTLLEHNYLTRDEQSKRFCISRKLLAMGHDALSVKPIVPNAIDIMRQCRDAIKETILIGTIVETECVVMEQVLGSHHFKFSVDLGARLSLHVSAPGKAILAYLPDGERKELLQKLKLVRFNERTITSKRALEEELRHVRECGFGLDRGEQLHGIHCIAAPVFGQHGYPVAAIWTTGPEDRLPPENFNAVGKILREHADQISYRLGWSGTDQS